ncbi:MAG TPA: hypothetical protein VLI06_09920 [Solimonas sp.]|nr:hypothetical protein [Solimonas sp.]
MKHLAWMLLLLALDSGAQPPAEPGTTIVGEQDAAIGLTLLPWAEEYASDLDRPPSRYDVPAQPLDAQAFIRRNEFDEAGLAWRREQLQRVH